MRWPLATALALVTAACRSGQTAPPPMDEVELPERVKGATVRPVGDLRRGYGTEKARETMKRLAGLGVNTIGVILEGRMTNLQDREIRGPSDAEMDAARRALLDAKALGLATVVVPHLYLDDGEWRGRIHFDDAEHADAWWSAHERYISKAAEVARAGGATVLSIGVELKALSAEAETVERMRALAAKVRSVYAGRLTYSANWDEAEQVAFWSVVDIAGVNGYYPLVPDPVRGAESVRRRLSALAERAGREVLLLEVGYRSGPMSHERPWEWPEDMPDDVDEATQARAWAAALSQWGDAPGVRGLLIWVIPTDPDDPASEPPNGFNPLNKKAEAVISSAFSPRSSVGGPSGRAP